MSPTRRLSLPGRLRAWGWLPHVLVGGLALPFIVRQNAWYEWSNTLWLLELQTAHVSAHGLPSYFIDGAGVSFYPIQLFYAGPILSALAYPAVLFGAWPVFATATAGAFAASSAGMAWTARNLGVSPRLALVPGVLLAVTPYTVSDLYGRGDWAELVAVSALPVALGAATSLLTGRARSRPGAVGALAIAVAVIAGTHNLTLLFSALLAPLLAIALLPLLRGPARDLAARYGLVIIGALVGLALVGVFLIPDIWLSGRTVINEASSSLVTQVAGFDRVGVILAPLPVQPRGTTSSDVHTQALALVLVWACAAGAITAIRRRLDRRTATTLALLLLTVVGITLLITNPTWWLSFPPALTAIQFTFRLVSYLALVTVLAVAILLGAAGLQRSRAAVAVLLLVTVWQVGIAIDLAVTAQGLPLTVPASSVSARTPPLAFAPFQREQFRLVIKHPVDTPQLQARVTRIGDDSPPRITLFGSQPAGTFLATNVIASPLIRFGGGDVSVTGATAAGEDVLYIKRSPWRATVQSTCTTCLGALTGGAPFALFAGRLLTVLGAMILAGLLAVGVRDLRRRRRQPARTETDKLSARPLAGKPGG